MDNIKLCATNEQDINSLIPFTQVFSFYIRMTLGLEKCGRLIVNGDKAKNTSRISLPESEIDDIDEGYKYLGAIQQQ